MTINKKLQDELKFIGVLLKPSENSPEKMIIQQDDISKSVFFVVRG